MTATVQRVSPNPKRPIPPDDQEAIRRAMDGHETAYAALRDAVLIAASHNASVRELAEFTGMSTNTISRWKREARDTPAQ